MLSRLAGCRAGLAAVQAARQEWPEAESQYLQARAIWEELLRQRPGDAEMTRLGYALRGLGMVHQARGEAAAAEEALVASLALWDRLAGDHPVIREYASNQAGIHQLLGELFDPSLHPPGQPDRAERHYLRAAALLEPLAKAQSRGSGAEAARAKALSGLERLHRALGKPARAEVPPRRP